MSISSVSDQFDEAYMAHRVNIAWRGPILAGMIKAVFKPTSVLDVGCGIGDIAAGLRDLDVDAWGLDASEAGKQHHVLDEQYYLYADITEPLRLSERFDLVVCFEVFSVIDAFDLPEALSTVAGFGDRVLCNHVPNMPDALPGFLLRTKESEMLKHLIEPYKHRPAFKAIYNTAQYFVKKRDGEDRHHDDGDVAS